MGKYNLKLDLENENSLSLIIDMLENNSKVLEFGPANGRLTRYMKEEMNCTVDIVEIDEESGKDAAEYSRYSFLGFERGDAEGDVWYNELQGEKYDFIIFPDILEHLRAPEKLLSRTRKLLTDTGYVLLSVPNIAHNAIILNLYKNDFPYQSLGLLDNTHIHFFTYNTLSDMINECGYKAVEEKATYCQSKDSEFHLDYDILPLEAREALRTKNMGNVYQFVFKICANSVSDVVRNELKYDYNKYNDFFLECYYITEKDTEYSESKSFRMPLNLGKNMFYLDLSKYEEIKEIRIDPINTNCRLKNFQLINSETNERINVSRANGLFVDQSNVTFETEDPQIYIEPVKKINISFEITCFENSLIKEIEKVELDDIEKSIRNNEIIADVRKEIEQQSVEIEQQSVEIEQKNAEIEQKNAEIEQKSKAIEQINIEHRQRKIEIEQKATELEQTKIIIEQRNVEIQKLNEKIAEENAKYNSIVHEYHLIASSEFWRMTKPLRVIVSFIKRIF